METNMKDSLLMIVSMVKERRLLMARFRKELGKIINSYVD